MKPYPCLMHTLLAITCVVFLNAASGAALLS
ncbi:Uncharacterised protein [Legionella geestiana]|nr:Uncharacterised protein [Legionella geestiana]